MQEIFDNYDGSFDELLNKFDQSKKLNKNYRCQKMIVNKLNKLYNDDNYKQKHNFAFNSTPRLILTDFSDKEDIKLRTLYATVCF